MRRQLKRGICRCGRCGEVWIYSKGFGERCYRRWVYYKRPDILPPPGVAGRAGGREGRIEDYLELLSWGYTREHAAERMGLCLRTIDRYDALLKQQAEAEGMAA